MEGNWTNMMKCKTFTETVDKKDNINIKKSAAWNFNCWSETTDCKIESVNSHADMNGEVKTIVVFYEERTADEKI